MTVCYLSYGYLMVTLLLLDSQRSLTSDFLIKFFFLQMFSQFFFKYETYTIKEGAQQNSVICMVCFQRALQILSGSLQHRSIRYTDLVQQADKKFLVRTVCRQYSSSTRLFVNRHLADGQFVETTACRQDSSLNRFSVNRTVYQQNCSLPKLLVHTSFVDITTSPTKPFLTGPIVHRQKCSPTGYLKKKMYVSYTSKLLL